MSFFVSAPGKAILFGEHSAVYGKPAIAAALALRTYMLVDPAPTGEVELFFPDLDISDKWKVDELPWDAVEPHVALDAADLPLPTPDLVPEILAALEHPLQTCTQGIHYSAARCFLYMYMTMCGRRSGRFCVRSAVPIGAGLGSSAATAVCLAAGMAVLGGHVTQSTPAAAAFIDSWAFMGEKCFHGNPSGIDNAVATFGGAVLYQRAGTAPVRQNLPFPEMGLLISNTKVPRSTATLVANVAAQHAAMPELSGAIIDAMGLLVQDAHRLMQERPLDHARLQQLVAINHGLLVSLGVSHPKLEQVKITAGAIGATKLTGAGGGGCALTVLNDEVSPDAVAAVQAEFAAMGMETYCTALGGKGVAMLTPTPDTERFFSKDAVVALDTREALEAALGSASWQYWS